jgi:hypothetical protein
MKMMMGTEYTIRPSAAARRRWGIPALKDREHSGCINGQQDTLAQQLVGTYLKIRIQVRQGPPEDHRNCVQRT